MNRTKKFTISQVDDPTPIGNLVHWYIKEQGIHKNEVAKKLDISDITLNRYFKQKTLQTIILWRIAKAINYNLFAFLADKINIDYTTHKETELQKQSIYLQQENRDLKRENELLKELIKK